MLRKRTSKNRKILSRSIFASLVLHVLAISFLQRNSLWFSPHLVDANQNQTPWKSQMEVTSRQEILKESFEPELMKTATRPKPVDDSAPLVKWEVKPVDEKGVSFATMEIQSPLLSHLSPPTLSLPPQDCLNLFEHLPKDLIYPKTAATPEKILSAIPSTLISEHPPLVAPPPIAQEKQLPSAPIHPDSLITQSWTTHATLEKAPSFFPAPQLPSLPTLSELETVSYSDAFDAELVFLPREEEKGYFFALTLIPRGDLKLPRLKQHYTFLVDRSNSIQSDRLFATKNAIRRALEELHEEDSFNILAFDSKLEKMSSNELPATAQSRAKAEAFLDNIKLGSFFSSADLYKALLMTVPATVKQDELYTTLLFTDGETLSKKGVQRDLLRSWTQYNGGKSALFPIGVSTDPQLALLDTAAMFNKGKLQFAPTHRGIKRKALKTMKMIECPIAKNMTSHAIALTPHAEVTLYPKSTHLPHLYLNEPYIILGTCNTLDDFIVFVQGHLKNRWLNIKKKISFLSAKRGTSSLKSEWALQCAYEQYEAYLEDGNPEHIAEAKALISPHNIQVAFE